MNKDDDKTIRPSDNIIPSDDEKTIRPSSNIINADNNDDDKTIRSNSNIISSNKIKRDDESTIRSDSKVISAKGSPEDLDQTPVYIPPKNFTLKEKVYNHIKTISQNTGEGQIYLVENDGQQVVLKLYLPNIQPKIKLVERLREYKNDKVIKVFDFGTTDDGRFYELMEYLAGGTLDKYLPIKDTSKLKKMVKDVADGLEFCHKNGIIHKDIKPSNIFLRDGNSDQYVLGDFGISSLFDSEDRLQVTSQARSDLYAAPEMYISRDGRIMITPGIDYYALGLSLIYIWNNKNPFKGINEMVIPQLKLDGQVKPPEDMPKDFATLVRGLIVSDPKKRWGYDEVQRYLNGEKVEVFDEIIKLDYDTFVFDAEENLFAKTPSDLARLMKDDPQTAKRYLYAGKIDEWLRKAKNTKLELTITEIYEKLFPKNQDAGLTVALYALDKEMPYTDIDGNDCDDVPQFVNAFLNHFEEYSEKLSNKNDSFYLYLHSRDNSALAEKFYSFFKKEKEKSTALLRVIYELAPSSPFRFVYTENNNLYFDLINDPAELSTYFDKYHSDAENAIFDGLLSIWLEAKIMDDSLSKEEKETYQTYLTWVNWVIENYDHNMNAARKIMVYVLNPQMGYLGDDDKTMRYTLDDMAQELFDFTDSYKERLLFIDDFFYLYLISRGWTDEEAYIRSLFLNINQIQKNKIGPYDEYMAVYKAMTYLGIKLNYFLEGTSYKEPSDLLKASSSDKKVILDDLKYINSYLFQWLSLFYQENPELDADETEFIYDTKLLELMEFVYKLDPKNETAKRFHDARKSIPKKINKEKAADKRFLLMKLISMIMPVATGTVLFMLVFFNPETTIETGFWNITPLYFISFLGLSLIAYFVTRGYGDGISFMNGFILSPLVALLSSVLIFYVFVIAYTLYPLSVGGIALLAIIYIFWKVFKFKSYTNKDVRNQLFDTSDKETFDFEPLAYAFSNNDNFKSTRLNLLNDYNMRRNEAKKVVMSNTIMPAIIFFSLIVLFAYSSRDVSNYLDEAGLSEKSIVSLINLDNNIPDIEGTWEGKIGNNDLKLLVSDQSDLNLSGKFLLGKENPTEINITGILDTANSKITFTNSENETYEADLKDENKNIAGIFSPKKGRKQNFNLAFVSSTIAEPEEEKVEEQIEESSKETSKKVTENKPVTKPNDSEVNKSVEESAKPKSENTDTKSEETKPTKFYAAPLSTNGVAFEIMDSYTLGGNRLRIDFRVTNNNSKDMEIIIPAKGAVAADNIGNQYSASIRSLANVTATTNDVDVIYTVNQSGMAYGGLIFENLKSGANLITTLNLKVDVNGSTTLKFTNIPIRIE